MSDATNSHAIEVLAADLRALKELMDERDRRYEERDVNRDRLYEERDRNRKEALDVALVTSEQRTSAAFNAAEKATVKTEEALAEYKAGANEWRDTVKDLIGNLRESRSANTGKDEQRSSTHTDIKWVLTTVLSLVVAGVSILVGFLRSTGKAP